MSSSIFRRPGVDAPEERRNPASEIPLSSHPPVVPLSIDFTALEQRVMETELLSTAFSSIGYSVSPSVNTSIPPPTSISRLSSPPSVNNHTFAYDPARSSVTNGRTTTSRSFDFVSIDECVRDFIRSPIEYKYYTNPYTTPKVKTELDQPDEDTASKKKLNRISEILQGKNPYPTTGNDAELVLLQGLMDTVATQQAEIQRLKNQLNNATEGQKELF